MKSNRLAVMAAALTLAAPVFAAPTYAPNAVENRSPPQDNPNPKDSNPDDHTHPDGYLDRGEMRPSIEPQTWSERCAYVPVSLEMNHTNGAWDFNGDHNPNPKDPNSYDDIRPRGYLDRGAWSTMKMMPRKPTSMSQLTYLLCPEIYYYNETLHRPPRGSVLLPKAKNKAKNKNHGKYCS
jgi:hypothetical protein